MSLQILKKQAKSRKCKMKESTAESKIKYKYRQKSIGRYHENIKVSN
jgi:hypothetical protein